MEYEVDSLQASEISILKLRCPQLLIYAALKSYLFRKKGENKNEKAKPQTQTVGPNPVDLTQLPIQANHYGRDS